MDNNNTDIHSELPVTHSFVYRDKKYPFNIYLFNCFSNYFQSKQHIYNHVLDINLSDEFNEDTILTEDSIKDFVNYCQKTDITLNNQNVLQLHKLSNKFMVTGLIKATENYISDHRNDFIIQFLTMNPDEQTADTEQYEEIISNYLTDYIQDERLIPFPVPFLFRVVTKYQLKNNNHTNSEVIQFLFKCLDYHGKKASVLFQNVDFCNEHSIFLTELFSDKYSDKFDFHFINTQFHKTIYEIHSQIIQKEEFIKNHNDNLSLMIISDKKRIENELFELKKKLNEEFENLIKIEKDKMTSELNALKMQLKEEFRSLIDEEKEKIKNDLISQQNEELNNLKNEYEMKLKEQENLFTQKLNDMKKYFEEKLSKKDEINDQLNLRANCPFNGNSNTNGIISYLNDSVTLEAGGDHRPGYPLSNIRTYDNKRFYNYVSSEKRSENDGWIEFDFGSYKIDLSSYLIRSNTNPSNTFYHPKSWRIVGSNDHVKWITLDARVGDSNLNGALNQFHFKCQENRYRKPDSKFKYIRYIQDDSWVSGFKYNIYITYFELYGDIYE